MNKKKVITISAIAVLVIAVLIASYMLVILPKMKNEIITERVAKAENGEKYEAGTIDTSNWDTENRVNIVYDTANVPVPVPKGYVASSIEGEHTVNTGFVIYEGTEEVTETNREEAQKTRNQWVWVPVENPNEIYGTDSQGKKHGKSYSFGSSGRTALNWTESNGVMSITSSTSYREPDILTSYDCDSYMPNYLTEETRNSLNKELKENFEMTIESIKKYGGFYIGRYETGGLNGAAKVVRGDTNISNQTWYTMYEKSKELRGTNSSVRTSMIWGCQWDATLEWLVKSESKTYEELQRYDNGNYGGTGDIHDNKKNTGYSESWKLNNIYDMAGNVSEWTLEMYGTDAKVSRGGYYAYKEGISSTNMGGVRSITHRYRYGASYTASSQNKNCIPYLSVEYSGTRGTLCIAL